MAFMATFVFSGISAEWYGIEKTISEYTTKSNFADIYLYGDNFTKDDLNKHPERGTCPLPAAARQRYRWEMR